MFPCLHSPDFWACGCHLCLRTPNHHHHHRHALLYHSHARTHISCITLQAHTTHPHPILCLRPGRERAKEDFSRRRAHRDRDVDFINDRNAHFNKKIERAFGSYTQEIKANLERGTALPVGGGLCGLWCCALLLRPCHVSHVLISCCNLYSCLYRKMY